MRKLDKAMQPEKRELPGTLLLTALIIGVVLMIGAQKEPATTQTQASVQAETTELSESVLVEAERDTSVQ